MKPPLPSPTPARNAYIDVLRGWSILGVVCVHFAGSFVTTDAYAWSPSFMLGLVLNQVFGFAVPLFLFLSGLLAASSTRQPGVLAYYLDRFQRIGLPYLLVSFLSFFLLNHYQTWLAVQGTGAKLHWLIVRVGFTGVEPTLYFIPLILQLYLLQPVLRALPALLTRLAPRLGPTGSALVPALVLLGIHVTLGLLCYHGRLDYYNWGRPNVLFWAFYFYAGLHFRAIAAPLAITAVRIGALGLGLAAAIIMGWNLNHLVDPAVTGSSFELNRLDFAYARPEMLAYDLAMVLALAAGIVLGLAPREGAFSYLGRYTLEVYLWHILALYFGAWQWSAVLSACRDLPELIVAVCATAAFGIAALASGWRRLARYSGTHRLVIVPEPES